MIMQCTNKHCGKRTTKEETTDRNYRTGACAHCNWALEPVPEMDGKTQAWRDAADKLLEALARDNKYVVADMVQIFLESANYGLDDYSPLGGVFRRAAKRGIIKRVARPTKQALWVSNIYNQNVEDNYISLCENCNCITKNICGKCKAEKGVL